MAAAPVAHTARIAEIVELGAEVRGYLLEPASTTAIHALQAGSLMALCAHHDDSTIEARYCIASSPEEARSGHCLVPVKCTAGGYLSSHILDTWKVGDTVQVGEPRQHQLFRSLGHSDSVTGLAAGMGIVPFRSLAKAVAEGSMDLQLTLLYQADSPQQLLFHDEWEQLVREAEGKLTFVPVLASGHMPGCETGPLTRETIERHADIANSTVLVCGPGPMVAAMHKELAPLKLPRRRLRSAFSGDHDYQPPAESSTEHLLTVRTGGTVHHIPAREDETILTALEKAGLQPPANCRSGICGFCTATVTSGDFVVASDETGARKMHDRHGPLHPCCSYPRSDMQLVVRRPRQR